MNWRTPRKLASCLRYTPPQFLAWTVLWSPGMALALMLGMEAKVSQGCLFLRGLWAKMKIDRASKPVWRLNMSRSLWSDHICMASHFQQGRKCILKCTRVVLWVDVSVLGFYWHISFGLYGIILFTAFSKPLQHFIIHIIRGSIHWPYVLQIIWSIAHF